MKPEVSKDERFDRCINERFFFQRIKLNQIMDLFPMLKDLYRKDLEDMFYVVKVWVRIR